MSSLSGLQCLSALMSQVRPTVNFSALVTEEVKKRYAKDEAKAILEMATAQDLRPEMFGDITKLAENYHGPTLVRMDNNEWLMLINAKQLTGKAVFVFDPTRPDPTRPLQANADQFIRHVGDRIIIFRNLQEFDARSQSGLFCLCAVANHHHVKMDVRRVMHDYAISDKEPREPLLLEIARDHQFKVRRVKLGWKRIVGLEHVFPIINRKKNGKYIIICGSKERPVSSDGDGISTEGGMTGSGTTEGNATKGTTTEGGTTEVVGGTATKDSVGKGTGGMSVGVGGGTTGGGNGKGSVSISLTGGVSGKTIAVDPVATKEKGAGTATGTTATAATTNAETKEPAAEAKPTEDLGGESESTTGAESVAETKSAPKRMERVLAVIDPEIQSPGEPQITFWNKKRFQEECSSNCIFLKKIYRLSDEDRPFGLSWFIPEFVKLRGIFGQIALVVVMLTLLSLVTPLFFQIVVDKVLVNRTYQTLNVLGIGIVVAILFNGLLEYIRSYFLLFATNKIDISTATKTFRHLMRLPIEFFERIPSGVLLKHMQQTEKIRGFLSGSLFFTILDLFSLCIFVPFLLLYSPQLTAVVMGYTLLMALIIALLIKPFQRRLNELYQAEGKRQSMLVESIHGIRTVKSLSLEPVEESVWDDSTAYAIKSYFRVGKISMAAKAISHVLEMLMMITVIWYGARLVFDYKITIGALIAFQMLAGRVTGPLVKLVGLIHEYQQIALSVRMLGVVMNTPKEEEGGGIRNPLRGDVEFERVTFSYRPDLPAVIKGLSLKVPRGQTVGIVGRSGSGKTTLTKLLQGLYPVKLGVVKVDGIDIREIDKAHLRSSIGVVLQDNYFFSGTVRENIAMTKRSASLEEIVYVAKLAGADEFIQKLNRGYDTVLEENASNLSGGQRQRLAIARALLPNPPILIFDEATSALDPESEYVIQRNLKQIARGRTVLIVSHRLSIVRHADNIIVIDEGVLSASGTHEQLLKQPGTYQEFWRQQMGRVD